MIELFGQQFANRGRVTFKTSAGVLITTARAWWNPLLSTYAGTQVDSTDVRNTALFVVQMSQRRLVTKLVKQSHYLYVTPTESYLITGLKDMGSYTEVTGLRQSVPVAFAISTAGGIISEWGFRSSSGLLTDEQSLNTLTNVGTVTYSASIPSPLASELGSAVFNGSNNLEIADASHVQLDVTGNITICCRFKVTSFATSRGIVCKGDGAAARGYYLYLSSGAKARFELSSDGTATSTAEGGTTIAVNTWYSLAATYNGSTISVYLNGSLDGSTSYSSGIYNNGTKFSIGVRGDNTQFHLGSLAHVMIMNQAKTAAQVADWHTTDVME